MYGSLRTERANLWNYTDTSFDEVTVRIKHKNPYTSEKRKRLAKWKLSNTTLSQVY